MESIDDFAKRLQDRHHSLSITSTAQTPSRFVKAVPQINASPISKVTTAIPKLVVS